MNDPDRVHATLLGTAVGDALGLVTEGLSAKTIARRFGRVERYHLLGRTGFVSDDTEQSALVAQSLARHPSDPDGLRPRLPPLAARVVPPPAVGRRPRHGARVLPHRPRPLALRRRLRGQRRRHAGRRRGRFLTDPQRRRATSDALARVTHTDPRAVEGARYVAEVAAAPRDLPTADVCTQALTVVDEPSLRAAIARGIALATEGADLHVAATELGTTGFVVHTLGFATYAFVRWGYDPLRAIQEVIAAGGDTDSIGAIVGAWGGSRCGLAWIPPPLLDDLHDGPFGPTHLRSLANDLAAGRGLTARYSPLAAMLRNLALYPVVLAHGFRRLIPW